MSYPQPPSVRPLTAKEKRERERRRERRAVDEATRAVVDARTADNATASPYDLLAAALFAVTSDALFAAVTGPGFDAALRERGYAVVPVAVAAPPAPDEWMQAAIDLYGADGTVTDLLETVDGLWAQAWQAGAESKGTTEGATPCM